MSNCQRALFGALSLCVGAASLAAGAAESVSAIVASASSNVAANNQPRSTVHAAVTAARGAAQAARVATPPSGSGSNEIFANTYRAYPPSCLNDGLPFGQFDAVRGAQLNVVLLGDPAACLPGGNANECSYSESVTFKAWRVACSGGKSAALFEIDRPVNLEGNSTLYPTLPSIYVVQGNKSLFVRYADDANTFYTTTYANQPLVYSDIFVLENFYGSATQFDFNQSFTLFIDNGTNGNNTPPNFAFPVYNAANYPNAALALPISGYMTSNWFDPLHGGEGMLTQIFDNNDGQTRTFTAAWYTFDQFGLPFWLYAQGTINIGARTTGNVDTYYASNGGFAGNFGSGATFTKWGTINFSFPDCNHMTFSFNGTASAVSGPTTNGATVTKTWLRIANVNGLFCE